jgi:hypothetical protein
MLLLERPVLNFTAGSLRIVWGIVVPHFSIELSFAQLAFEIEAFENLYLFRTSSAGLRKPFNALAFLTGLSFEVEKVSVRR